MKEGVELGAEEIAETGIRYAAEEGGEELGRLGANQAASELGQEEGDKLVSEVCENPPIGCFVAGTEVITGISELGQEEGDKLVSEVCENRVRSANPFCAPLI